MDPSLSGHVYLLGETDHSGTEIRVVGTPFAAITDSSGYYEIWGIPLGVFDLVFDSAPGGFHQHNALLPNVPLLTPNRSITLQMNRGQSLLSKDQSMRIDRIAPDGTSMTLSTLQTAGTYDGSLIEITQQSEVYHGPGVGGGFDQYAPDATFVVRGRNIDGLTADISIYPTNGTAAVEVASAATWDYQVSPDSKFVVYEKAGNLRSYSLETEVDSVLGTDGDFVISPDSKWVLCRSGGSLSKAHIDGSGTTDIYGGGGSFAIAPDQSRIVYWASAGAKLMSVPFVGGTPVEIGSNVAQFDIVPDSSTVIYREYDYGLFAVPVSGGTAQPLAVDARSIESLSPDGSHVLYWNGSATSVVPVAGGTPVELTAFSEHSSWFTPDSIYVFGYSGPYGAREALWSTGVSGGPGLKLSDIDPGFDASVTTALDGHTLIYNDSVLIRSQPIEGGTEKVISNLHSGNFAISPDRQSIFYVAPWGYSDGPYSHQQWHVYAAALQ